MALKKSTTAVVSKMKIRTEKRNKEIQETMEEPQATGNNQGSKKKLEKYRTEATRAEKVWERKGENEQKSKQTRRNRTTQMTEAGEPKKGNTKPGMQKK